MTREGIEEKESAIAIDFRDLLMSYVRKWWMIVLCALLVATITFSYTFFFVAPTYRASISVYVNNGSTAEGGHMSSSDLNASIHLVKSYMSIVRSHTVMEKVSERLDQKYSPNALLSMVTTSQITGTELFNVFVVHENPEEAATIADTIADVAPSVIEAIITGSKAKIVDYAQTPRSQYTPNYTSNTLLGGAIGALVAIVALTVAFLRDNRIKDENDLTDMFDIPILGRIPDFEYAVTGHHYSYGSSSGQGGNKK